MDYADFKRNGDLKEKDEKIRVYGHKKLQKNVRNTKGAGGKIRSSFRIVQPVYFCCILLRHSGQIPRRRISVESICK